MFALVKQKLMRVEGDLHPFMANLLYFKDVIASPRKDRKQRPRDEPALTSRLPAATCISTCSESRTGFMSRKQAKAFPCSACTPPAPTRGNIAA